MLLTARSATILLSLALLVAGFAFPAAAQERCDGTLCDLYYGNRPAAAPAAQPLPAAPATTPTLVTVPGVSYLSHLFSGGGTQPAAAPVAAVPAPSAPQHCEGTICDFYYGTSTPWDNERPAAQPSAQAAAPGAAEPVADADPDGTPEPVGNRRVAERPAPAVCAATGRDPWACYR